MDLFNIFKSKKKSPVEVIDARDGLTRLNEALSEVENKNYDSAKRSIKIARSKVHEGKIDKSLAHAYEALDSQNYKKSFEEIKKNSKTRYLTFRYL